MQVDLDKNIKIRNATQVDVNFIFSTWQKAYRYSVKTAGIESEIYFNQQHTLIEGLMKTAYILVACSTADPTQIYGYLCYEKIEDAPVVHFAYVKKSYRNLGIGKLLLSHSKIDPKAPFFITHHTGAVDKLNPEHYFAIYNPYLAYPAYASGREQQKEDLGIK